MKSGSLLGDRFLLAQSLGEGAFGEVWSAKDTSLGRRVAVKILRDAIDPGAMEQLRKEAIAQAKFDHENICKIYDCDVANGRPFLVMELLVGDRLSDILAGKRLTAPALLELGVNLAQALVQLAKERTVHRDIKPHNIMLVPGRGYVLYDFGLAKYPSEPNEGSTREVP